MPRNARLEEVLKAAETISYGRDDSPDFVIKTAPWRPPAVVAADVREAAVTELQATQDLLKAAGHKVMEDWLIRLGQMVIPRRGDTAADVLATVMAYAGVMSYPLGCFTMESVERAGRRFKFFPAYAEVAEFLDQEKTALETRVSRLQRVSEAEAAPKPKSKPKAREKRYWEMSPEEREKFDARIAKIKDGANGAQASTLASQITRGFGMPGVDRSFDPRSKTVRGRPDDLTDDDLEERKAEMRAQMAAAGFEV